MKFEFTLNEQERKKLERINRGRPVGPLHFMLIIIGCFLPSILGVAWLQMWEILAVGGTLVLLASLIPLLRSLQIRKPKPHKSLPRSIELTPVGMAVGHGNSHWFVKWNHVEDLLEMEDGFLFGRQSRFTLLPLRVITEAGESVDQVRDSIGQYRNVPENPNEPIEKYQRLFAGRSLIFKWNYEIERHDLVKATTSTLVPVHEKSFEYKEVTRSGTQSSLVVKIVIGLMILIAGALIVTSLPNVKNQTLILAICFVPFLLLIGAAALIRRRAIRNLPLIRREAYEIGLFQDGWASGNENVCTFHKWQKDTRFFLLPDFVGIRIESGVVNIIPKRAIGENPAVFDFVSLAIRLKREALGEASGKPLIGQVPEAELVRLAELAKEVDASNPYASPVASRLDIKRAEPSGE